MTVAAPQPMFTQTTVSLGIIIIASAGCTGLDAGSEKATEACGDGVTCGAGENAGAGAGELAAMDGDDHGDRNGSSRPRGRACATCGNGVLERGEVCDGSDVGSATCESLGFPLGGELRCNETCSTFDTTDCRVNGPEWVQEATLIASDGGVSNFAGWSVAVSGDTALVGAWGATVDGNSAEGAAYIFTRAGGVWTEQAKLTASDGDQLGAIAFGWAVALSGDIAVVGAPCHPIGFSQCAGISPGAAYVFMRNGGVWTEQARLAPSDGMPADFFGLSVALAGETILVGAPDAEVGGQESQGTAYVFARAAETWSEQAKLTASDGAALDAFGGSAALSGDVALVGATNADVGSNAGQGASYVFVRAGESWTEQTKLTASDGAAGAGFGASGAVSADTAVVGASTADVDGNAQQGAAYVFSGGDVAWNEQAKLVAPDGTARAQFGASVAVLGDTALVGAPSHQLEPNTANGQAYVFTRTDGTWSQAAQLSVDDGFTLGQSVAVSEDDTIVLGAPSTFVDDTPGHGVAHVFAPADGSGSPIDP